VSDENRGSRIEARPLPPMVREILDAGGLVEFVRLGRWDRLSDHRE